MLAGILFHYQCRIQKKFGDNIFNCDLAYFPEYQKLLWIYIVLYTFTRFFLAV